MSDKSSNGPTDPAEIEADIERTRADLAETVDQLTAKLDVKQRTRDKVASVKGDAADRLHQLGGEAADRLHRVQDRATDEQGRPRPAVSGAGAGVVLVAAALVALSVWRRRRARRPSWRR